MARDRPVVHQPAALVDLVDQVVDHVSGPHPEQIDLAELELLDQIIGLRAHIAHPTTVGETIGADVGDFTHLATVNLVDHGSPSW